MRCFVELDNGRFRRGQMVQRPTKLSDVHRGPVNAVPVAHAKQLPETADQTAVAEMFSRDKLPWPGYLALEEIPGKGVLMDGHGSLGRPFRAQAQVSQHAGFLPPFRLRFAPGPAKQRDFEAFGLGEIGDVYGEVA
jgi:hypothetical protein